MGQTRFMNHTKYILIDLYGVIIEESGGVGLKKPDSEIFEMTLSRLDFTPWLADNIDLLADAVGLDITVDEKLNF